MKLVFEKNNIDEYLVGSEIINITAKLLKKLRRIV
jgi:hypothetical protein